MFAEVLDVDRITPGLIRVRFGGGDLHEFEGKMGPTRVYKGRALSDAEVLQNFNAQRGRFGV